MYWGGKYFNFSDHQHAEGCHDSPQCTDICKKLSIWLIPHYHLHCYYTVPPSLIIRLIWHGLHLSTFFLRWPLFPNQSSSEKRRFPLHLCGGESPKQNWQWASFLYFLKLSKFLDNFEDDIRYHGPKSWSIVFLLILERFREWPLIFLLAHIGHEILWPPRSQCD